MTLNTRTLKVVSSIGAVALCGVSCVLVAIDPKPPTAPLRPPVAGPTPGTSGLLIPKTCAAGGDAEATLDPSLLPVAQQLRAATSAAARRMMLASLTSSQRLEVEAYVRSLNRRSTSLAGCGEAAGAGGTIAPSVIDAPPSTQPLINTYVS